MSVLPLVSRREVIAALKKVGYEKDRQKGTLRAIIRHAGLAVEEFKQLL